MTTLVKGSLSAIAKEQNIPLAETWLNVDAVILVDVSGSMNAKDTPSGRSRYEVADEELAKLQGNMPGKLAIIAFSNHTEFTAEGRLREPNGMTDLAGALKFGRIADAIPGMRFILISDGEPDDEGDALREAEKFKNRIDTIFVGPERGRGEDFLKRLARLKQGVFGQKSVEQLSSGIAGLLN